MNDILTLLLLVIATERMTEIIVDSKLFEPLRMAARRWAYDENKPPEDNLWTNIKIKLDYLINCGYCTSVWVGGGMSIFLPYTITKEWGYNVVVSALVLHGLSNLYHVVYELLRRGRVNTIDLTYRNSGEIEE